MVRKIVVGQLQTNCYIVGDEHTRKGVIIDPGDEAYRIERIIHELSITPLYILITHGHFDHTGAAEELKYALGIPIWMHALDRRFVSFEPDKFLREGDLLSMGRHTIRVLHCPGHSPGSICFYTSKALFCGDVLFMGSVGRTDFPGGSHSLLISAIREKILPLGDDVRVYPGHGPVTTVGRERAFNPFLSGLY